MNLTSGQTMLSQAYRARCATIRTELENADYRAQNPLKKSRKKEEESLDEGETLELLQAEADEKEQYTLRKQTQSRVGSCSCL
jgi:hypothetical protein